MKFFKRLKKKINRTSKLSVKVVYSNDLVNNVYAASTCCYDNLKPNISYDEKLSYIEKRVAVGHNSVIEHGYMIINIKIPESDFDFYAADIASMSASKASQYLKWRSNDIVVPFDDDNKYYTIAGSIRAFKHYIVNCKTVENILNSSDDDNVNEIEVMFLKAIIEYVPSAFFSDIIGTLSFIDMHFGIKDTEYGQIPTDKEKKKKFTKNGLCYTNIFEIDICDNKGFELGIDSDKFIDSNSDVTIAQPYNINDLPVTIIFKNMSRTATHQLVRHRNAITQESQRYVNISKNREENESLFTIPDIIDKDKKYKLSEFGEITIPELVDKLMSIYPELVEQGMKKEDARSFLPSNVNCKKLYMTFTFESLIKFIMLRTDPHAQAEIRSYAKAIEKSIAIEYSIITDETVFRRTTGIDETIARSYKIQKKQ